MFLDRDGVINRAIVRDGRPHPPQTLREVELVPDALPALQRLHDEGFLLIVVTNQPDVARGTQERSEVEAINNHLAAALPIDEFVVCYHDDDAECECRKPKPGGILDAAARLGIDVKSSFLIGDRWRDIEAGQRAGCSNYFIDYGYAERQPVRPFSRVHSLAEAVRGIVGIIATEES